MMGAVSLGAVAMAGVAMWLARSRTARGIHRQWAFAGTRLCVVERPDAGLPACLTRTPSEAKGGSQDDGTADANKTAEVIHNKVTSTLNPEPQSRPASPMVNS